MVNTIKNYTAPRCKVIEVKTQKVLCQSTQGSMSITDYMEEDL